MTTFDPGLQQLERLSNSVPDLIDLGRFDDAERICHELRLCFPDMIDWLDRTAELCEARGDHSRAIEHYRLCIEYIEQNPDGFDRASKARYRRAIKRIESRMNA